jgi:hypothetical protein
MNNVMVILKLYKTTGATFFLMSFKEKTEHKKVESIQTMSKKKTVK